MNRKNANPAKRHCVGSGALTIGDLDVRGHLRVHHTISSPCGGATLTLRNGGSILNSHLSLPMKTLSVGRMHATETLSAASLSVSGLITACYMSVSGSLTGDSLIGQQAQITKSLVVGSGIIRQQAGGQLLLGALSGVTHLNTDFNLQGGRTLTAGSIRIDGLMHTSSGVIKRHGGASLTLSGGTDGSSSFLDSGLCLGPKGSLTSDAVIVTRGVLRRPAGASFTLGFNGASSVLSSDLELPTGALKASSVSAEGFYGHTATSLGSVNVSAIERAVSTVSSFDYLQFSRGQGGLCFGVDAGRVRELSPSLAPVHANNAVDYFHMVPLLGAAVKDQHSRRIRVGRVELVGGSSTIDVVGMYGPVYAHFLEKARVVVLAQNETGWSAVRGRLVVNNDKHSTVVIQCVDPSSMDSVGYCIVADVDDNERGGCV
jgi:hypothetical protein